MLYIYDASGNFTGFYENDKPEPQKAPTATKDDAKKPTSAPARKPQNVNKPAPASPGGNGQKPTNTMGAAPPDVNRPSPRQWNPLSKFSSYTYCLTLYMVTPEALNYFCVAGKLPSPQNETNGYMFKVAESGGISGKDIRALTLDRDGKVGPNEPGLDFFIDNLIFNVQTMAADGVKTATVSTDMSFTITEPIGYTLLTKMMKASYQINALSPLIQSGKKASPPNLYQQHYMLSMKFYGYDENGGIVQSSEPRDMMDGDPNALFLRVIPIVITNVEFKIDGRATVYNITATTAPHQVGFGTKRGIVLPNTELEGATVGDVLGFEGTKNKKSLIYQLNEIQQDLMKNKNISKPNQYVIEWVKNEVFDSNLIKNSQMSTSDEFNRATAAMARVSNVQQSNVQQSQKSQTANKNDKIVSVSPGTAIPMVIDQVISKSKYIVDTLTKENNSRIETQTKDNSPNLLTWYSIHPSIEALGRDDSTNDWVYKITYQIVPYQVPYVKSQYVTGRSPYYGPVKQYSYLLTGENTEIVSLDITYNNLFYVQQPSSTTKDNSAANKNNPSPATPRIPSNTINSTQGGAGVTNNASMISDSVRSSLYSPNEQMLISLTIMGDPDFLMDPIGKKINSSNSFAKFYGPNNAINPYGGQIFCEIIYDVAEDYKDNGLLDIDPQYSLQFYPLEIVKQTKSKGLIYKINKIQSTFSRGKFTQQLDMIQVAPHELIITDANKTTNQNQREEKPQPQPAGATRKPSNLKISPITPNQSAAETARLNRTRLGNVNTGNPKDDAVVNQTRRGNIPRVGLARLKEELEATVRDDIRGDRR